MGWGGGPRCADAREQPRKGAHCFSHTNCGQGVVRCSRNDSLVQSALPFVFCSVWSLKLVTNGGSSAPSRTDFCKTDEIHK